jgi:hypothetical protein
MSARGTVMETGEQGNGLQQIATDLKKSQRLALELLLLGYGDQEIAAVVGVRRETIWRWKHRDASFRAELGARRATLADAAAARMAGMLDQAVSAVQGALSGKRADPKLAMSVLTAMGVFERSRMLERGEPAMEGGGMFAERDEEAVLEHVLTAVEIETRGMERIGAGEIIADAASGER